MFSLQQSLWKGELAFTSSECCKKPISNFFSEGCTCEGNFRSNLSHNAPCDLTFSCKPLGVLGGNATIAKNHLSGVYIAFIQAFKHSFIHSFVISTFTGQVWLTLLLNSGTCNYFSLKLIVSLLLVLLLSYIKCTCMMVGLFSFHSKVDVKTNIQSRDERRSKVSDKCYVCHDTHTKNDYRVSFIQYQREISMVDSW